MVEAAGLRAGPNQGQAGGWPEAVGLVAGPGWALGRGPGRHAGHARVLVNATTGVAGAVTTRGPTAIRTAHAQAST